MNQTTNPSRAHVLVIDDNVNHLAILKERLAGRYEVSLMNSAADAITVIDSGVPILYVLTDLVMPDDERNGIDVIRRLRIRDSPIPAVAMSGEASREAVALAMREGAIDFVEKDRLLAPSGDGPLETLLTHIEEEVMEFRQKRKNQLDLIAQATLDEKTGLYLYRVFASDMRQELSRYNRLLYSMTEDGINAEITTKDRRYNLSLVFIDINDMNLANKALGHTYVDKFILKLLGIALIGDKNRRLGPGLMREELDRAYRYGGDEVAVILKDTNSAGAVTVAERVMQRYQELRENVTYEQYLQTLGGVKAMDKSAFIEARNAYGALSMGIAQAPPREIQPEEFVNLANIAMYHAKAKSKKTSPPRHERIVYVHGMTFSPDASVSRKRYKGST